MKTVFTILAIGILYSATALAQLKVVGNGEAMSIDPSGFPPKMQAAYSLMQQKCGTCHTVERVIVSLQTGLCPLSKTSFNKDTAKSIVVRMFLKPESGMTRDDMRTIVGLLNFMIDEKAKEAKITLPPVSGNPLPPPAK